MDMTGVELTTATECPPHTSPSFSGDLMVRALNYHGQQLTSFVKETKIYEHLDMKNVDYHLYHQRSRELRMEDRGKRLLLHRFISQNCEKLYRENVSTGSQTKVKLDNDQVEEHAALLPPFEAFTTVDEDDRCRHFFDSVALGDCLLCRVVQKSMSGLMLTVLCLDPVTNKSRYIEDLKIRCFCPSGEMIPACDPTDPVRSYEAGDTVRVVCLEVKLETQRLMAGMKSSGLKLELQNIVKLGLCQPSELPPAFTYSGQAIEKKIPYSLFLEKSVGFINPTNVSHLAGELGLEVVGDSLMPSLTGRFRPETYASSLRSVQASKWAYKHVAQGIKYFKAGNNVEAFQCLNQALNIDNDNVEGLVARGALYANNGALGKAVEDFDKALVINRNHKNARKYLCETLIAVARNHEDENKVDSAIETYQKILTIVPDHKEALDSVFFLRGKPKDAPLRDDPKEHDRNKPQLVLDEEKKTEKKKKKKRRKEHASESSLESSSDSDQSRRQKKKKRKENKSKSRSPSPLSKSDGRPVSPFSARMAPGAGGLPAGGDMNMPEEFQPPTEQKSNMNLPLPDLRQDIERIKSQKSIESGTPGRPEPAVPPGFPLIDLTKPPPGYNPYYQGQYSHNSEKEYDEKVRRFLEETASDKRRSEQDSVRDSSRHGRRRSRSRSRSRGKRRKSGERSKDRRSRSSRREKSESRGKKSRRSGSKSKNKVEEPILIEDDDFTKKLNDHLSGSDRQGSSARKKSHRSKSRERKSDNDKDSKGEKEKRKSSSNVFGSEDELNSSREEEGRTRRPSGGGMWIPTGEDSIVDGVKEAISKLGGQDKRRRSGNEKKVTDESDNANYEIRFDKRTGMYIRTPKEASGRNGEVHPSQNISNKTDDVVETESRIIRTRRSRSKSKDRTSRHRSRSRSRTRRRRSRSRRRRSRSSSRRHRSRPRSHSRRRRDSRTTRRRSKSRSKSDERRWKDRGSYQAAQSSLQEDIKGMREETKRLESERHEVEREKAKLLTGGSRKAETKASDEFSGLDNVMNSVLEVVTPVAPSNIIPGTQTFEDLEAFIKRKKEEKKEELKKKL